MYIQRAAEKAVKQIIETFPVVLVTGPRQVGKSTMLNHLAEDAHKRCLPPTYKHTDC